MDIVVFCYLTSDVASHPIIYVLFIRSKSWGLLSERLEHTRVWRPVAERQWGPCMLMRLHTTRCGRESSRCPFVRMFHVWRLSSPPDTDGFKGSNFPLFIIECSAKQYITTSTTFSHNSPNPLSWCGCVSAAVAVDGFASIYPPPFQSN